MPDLIECAFVGVSLSNTINECNKVRRKEGSGQGWLVKTQVFLLTQINSHRCALCVTRKHQLSRLSQRSLSVFVPTVSLWQLVRPSLHSVSLNELPFHGGFYPVSTPITAIRHRWSSFCTWPTYLPLSPESFSRCRLRWTTPPSPQWDYSIKINNAMWITNVSASQITNICTIIQRPKNACLNGTYYAKNTFIRCLNTVVWLQCVKTTSL